MEDTCIVCLGELATTSTSLAEPAAAASDASTAPKAVEVLPPTTTTNPDDAVELIAHLLPCNHNLHNDCLRPWVERANSCPTCRATFNMVELRTHLNASPISSYGVQDRKQTAEIDETLVIDESILDDGPSAPCIFCDENGDDELLLLCDGCNNSCHTYCSGLDRVPAGAWFCQFCDSEAVTIDSSAITSGRRHRREQQSRRRAANPDPGSLAWTQIWQSVLQRTNIDLDFPYEEDPEEIARTAAHQREFSEWQQRFRVAERQGGAARFRDTASTVLATRPGARTATPSPESQEELRAWNAFDKANELQMEATNTRKRGRSSTASPQEPQTTEPERQLKRPRQRRLQDITEASPAIRSEPTPQPSSDASTPLSTRDPARVEGPSFLQSLLKEVETAPTASTNSRNTEGLTIAVPNRSDSSSPVSLSPNVSPISSNRSSPSPRSLSPSHRSRPSSPPLSSRIDPSWLQQRNFSPVSPAVPSQANSRVTSRSQSRARSRPHHDAIARSNETSPTRTMSLTDKEEIQVLVKDNLRPLYRQKQITSQQYTEINRDISRQLYDQIATGGGFKREDRDKWRDIATTEVEAAVKALQSQGEGVAQGCL